MWILADYILGIWLFIISQEDGANGYISAKYLWPVVGVVIGYVMFSTGGTSLGIVHLWGGVFSFLFVVVSKFTQESIGSGDCVVLFILGIYLGIWEFIEVCIYGFFLCGLLVVIGVARGISRKQSGVNDEIPLLPFIFVAYLYVLII